MRDMPGATLVIDHLTPRAADWLRGTGPTRARSVHAGVIYLERAVGLVALTMADIPLSPLSLRLCIDQRLPEALVAGEIADLAFDLSAAVVWQPRPFWATGVARQLPTELVAARQQIEANLKAFAPVVLAPAATGPLPLALVGLGPGLTPAGDDVLIGRLLAHHAGWLQLASNDIDDVLTAARSRTTRISQAFLAAAAAGECGKPWHDLWARSGRSRSEAIRVILGAGHTSGAATLWGFLTATEAQNHHAPDRYHPGPSDR